MQARLSLEAFPLKASNPTNGLPHCMQARLSLEAFAKTTSGQTDGLLAEHASRDDSYYWRWT